MFSRPIKIKIFQIYLSIYLYGYEGEGGGGGGGIISLISTSYISNLKSFALIITIGEPHVIA